MKKKYLLCTFISGILLLFSTYAFGQPVITFTELSHDFGDVDQGEELEYTFTFTNTGTEVLVIEKVTSS